MTEHTGVDYRGLRGLEVLAIFRGDRLKVVAEFEQRLKVEVGRSVGALKRGDERLDSRLRCAEGEGREAGINDVHTRFNGLQDGHRGHAAGVVGVKLERNVDDFFESREEIEGVVGGEESGHVLYADAVGFEVEKLPRLVDVVVEVVDGAAEDALLGDGVADRQLEVRAGVLDGGGGPFEVHTVVEGVEDSEYVYAGLGRPADEGIDHVVRVRTIPDQCLAAKEHLQGRIGNELLEGAKALPGVFAQESRRRVEGRASPDLHGVETDGVHPLGDGHHVFGAQAGCHQALMGVSERGVGDLDGSGGGHELRAVAVLTEGSGRAFKTTCCVSTDSSDGDWSL